MNTIDSFKDDFDFLSNFYPAIVQLGGITYPTSEHAFQAEKSVTDNDKVVMSTITTPGRAKRLGRRIKIRSDWDDVKYSIMLEILRIKFGDSVLKFKLLDTYPLKLVEGNMWHDNYWGDCKCPKCKNIKGQNNLGELLMFIRKEIMEKK